MEFKLNQKLYIIVGSCLLLAGVLLVAVPLVLLIITPTSQMVNMATRLGIIGGILVIPGVIGLERFLHQGLVFLIGVGLVVAGAWLGVYLIMTGNVPGLAILAILLLLAGIPSILNSIFIYGWLKGKVELSKELPVDTQQVYHALMVYAILLAIALGCGLLIALWVLL